MSLQPRWYRVLPPHIRPPEDAIARLEELRAELGLDDEAFVIALASSAWAVVRAQEATLESLRQQFPDAEEKRLWTAVVYARLELKLQSPAPWDPPPEAIQARMEKIAEIMRPLKSWDDVLRFVLEMDSEGRGSDPSSPPHRIHRVLTQ